jgi:hypothetical protein
MAKSRHPGTVIFQLRLPGGLAILIGTISLMQRKTVSLLGKRKTIEGGFNRYQEPDRSAEQKPKANVTRSGDCSRKKALSEHFREPHLRLRWRDAMANPTASDILVETLIDWEVDICQLSCNSIP